MGSRHCRISFKKTYLISASLRENEACGVDATGAIWLPHFGNTLAFDRGDSTLNIYDSQKKDLTHPKDI